MAGTVSDRVDKEGTRLASKLGSANRISWQSCWASSELGLEGLSSFRSLVCSLHLLNEPGLAGWRMSGHEADSQVLQAGAILNHLAASSPSSMEPQLTTGA